PPTRRAPRSLWDGRLWGGVWTDVIGGGALHEKVSALAYELGGLDLQVQVLPLLTGLSVKLAQLADGGHAWPLTAGGHKYELFLAVKPVGKPRHVDDVPSAALKMYTRKNETQGWRQRRFDTNNIQLTGAKRIPEESYLSVSGTVGQAR